MIENKVIRVTDKLCMGNSIYSVKVCVVDQSDLLLINVVVFFSVGARYKNFRKYLYTYTTESRNGVSGTANLRNGPKVSCKVYVYPCRQSCDALYTLFIFIPGPICDNLILRSCVGRAGGPAPMYLCPAHL